MPDVPQSSLTPLPIDPLVPELVATLEQHNSLVLEAPPGAGKTTRLPPALLDSSVAEGGEIWVLEPRRLAVRLAANRVAQELGQKVGQTVGYSIRFETVSGPATRLRFVTEGILLRRLATAPRLAGISAVVLDEFHERHLETDVALAFLLHLQRTSRPDLKLAVMSATLDGEPVARHLGCPLTRTEGKAHPVELEFLPTPDPRPLETRVADALNTVAGAASDGDVLVFLPGVGEIAAAERASQTVAERHGLALHRLHGSLSREEQDAVLSPSQRRKVILATNVAETSVTIEGITTVIDSGLVKEAGYSPWSGLPNLQTRWVSQASASQRTGRAGRVRPGRCLRLYTRREYEGFDPFSQPELQRAELSGLLLALRGAGVRDPAALPWLQPPPSPATETAETLLLRLGAAEPSGALTPVGRRMLKYPAHPRLARILCEAEELGVLDSAALAVAAVEQPNPYSGRRWKGERAHSSTGVTDHPSDPIRVAEGLWESPVSAADRKRILRTAQQYCGKRRASRGSFEGKQLTSVLKSLLVGFPDRVTRRAGEGEVLLCSGGRAILDSGTCVRKAEYAVAIEAREDPRRGGRTYVTQASSIEPDWLLGLPGDVLREEKEIKWDQEREKVEVVEFLLYDGLVLDEQKRPAAGVAEAADLLASEALKAGLERFYGVEPFERLLGRMSFLKSLRPELEVADRKMAEEMLRESCRGKASFRELAKADLRSLLRYSCSPEVQRALKELAPDEVRLDSGQRLAIEYPSEGRPWTKGKVQSFYGQKETPTIGGGRVPLQLRLLAPNQRPAQITDDLGGFWRSSYEYVRKDLRGRYPKHYWPDDPANAKPVQLRKNAEGK